METVKDNVIDFARFMQPPPGWDRIRPIGDYLERAQQRLQGGGPQGEHLPWPETRHKVAFRPAEVTLWSGKGGHKKSMLLGQCVNGWIAEGARVLMASLELPPDRTLERLVRQATGVGEPTNEEIGRFEQWSDGKLWVYDELSEQPWRKMAALCRWAAEELKVTHCVIDSLMMCGITWRDVVPAKQFMGALLRNAKFYNMHVHLVAHGRKGGNELRPMIGDDIAGTADLYNLADNVFLLWQNVRKLMERDKPEADRKEKVMQQADAMLRCSKQRYGAWEGWVRLWFEQNSVQHVTTDSGRAANMMSAEEDRW